MRPFTEAEKQQLRAKRKDQQERRLKGFENVSPNEKYWSLAFVFCAVVFNVILFLQSRRFGTEQLYMLVITLIALFDHIAAHFVKQDWKRRLLKTVEWVIIFLALAYVAYQVWIRFAPKLTATFRGG